MSDFDPTETVAPGDTQSTNNSQSKVRQAWDAWSSDPANNAFLLQTGLALLQPRSPGQSGIGQFANAIGQGAEASSRNTSERESEAQSRETLRLKGEEAKARTTTANAYADSVKQNAAGSSDGTKGALALQKAYRQWLAKPEDTTGSTTDPIVGAISKKFPHIKSKADLLADPAASAEAFRLFKAQIAGADEGGDTGTPAPSSPPPSSAPAPQQGRPVYDKATGAVRGFWYPDRGYVPNGQ